MRKLLEGYARYRREVFAAQRELFEQLAAGQQPEALFITCSDSRVVPSLITQTIPGTLFELQNAGNIVPPYGAELGGGSAPTIEYAVSVLKVRNVIVCGHSLCGAMQALLAPETLSGVPAVRSWLEQAEVTRRLVIDQHPHGDPELRLQAAVEHNARVQLDNLRTHPAVATALRRGELALHAWVYDFRCGEVGAYDPGTDAYLPLPEELPPPSGGHAASGPGVLPASALTGRAGDGQTGA